MKIWKKRALALTGAAVLVAGTALASSAVTTRTLQAQFSGMRLKVNGQDIVLTDSKGRPAEPFVIDGTTYVPVRSLGEALGKQVAWDPETNTVSVGLAPMEEDAQALVSIIEASHPAFALDMVPEEYEPARSAFLQTAKQPDVTLVDFVLSAMAYTSSLHDSHTQVSPFGNTPQALLDVNWTAGEGMLKLSDGKEVVAIGGLPVADLFACIDKYIAYENQAGREHNYAMWSRTVSFINLFGAKLQGDNTLLLTLADGSEQSVGWSVPAGEASTVTTQKMGDVLYVDFNQCVLDEALDAAVHTLADEVAKGTTKVILDVRGNGGGNSAACERLLSAMGMTPPAYGGVVRYSPLAQSQRGYQQAEGTQRQAPDLSAARMNPDIHLVVLTDESTFSSATMLAAYVRDGKLGTLIGRSSGNAPSHYGDILFYQLGNTGLTGTVSHIQWLRPDQNAQGDALTPDIETLPGEDALERALDFLADL